MQLIKIKQETPTLDLVILGAGGAHLVSDRLVISQAVLKVPKVAEELAAADMPVILTSNRGAPDTFEKINTLPGPPLSRMAAEVLTSAGVTFGLAIAGESKLSSIILSVA